MASSFHTYIQISFLLCTFCILIQISLKFVPKGQIGNKPTLASLTVSKLLSEPIDGLVY